MKSDLAITERIKRLVIVAMVSDDQLLERLVLKGGNLLDIAYGISTRASVDIDFSVEGNLDTVTNLAERVESVLTTTFLRENLTLFDFKMEAVPPLLSDDMKSFWGGYKIRFKLIESDRYEQMADDIESLRRQAIRVGKRGSTSFTIDISNHEYCGGKVARTVDDYTVFTYSPAMIVAEKLRAICQQMPDYAGLVRSNPRARARDFVDINVVATAFDIDFRNSGFRDLLGHIFAAKKVPLPLLSVISNYREYHRGDFVSVQDSVKAGVELDSYDYYFDFVLKQCDELESFWNE